MKRTLPRIGVDLMGGETPPDVLLLGLLELLSKLETPLEITFFIHPSLAHHIKNHQGIQIVHANESISLDDHPIIAIKEKKASSMHIGIQYLREGNIDAFISVGNTGALLALSKISLAMIQGISRPALLALMPTCKHHVAVLDLGANVSCKPHYFVEFAKMGVAYQKLKGIEKPKVGILNIGTEELKGTVEIRQAKEHLETFSKHEPLLIPFFSGNVESHHVFAGEVDVLITEGFTGNIFLKTAEATLSFLLHELRAISYEKQAVDKLDATFCQSAFPGALLIGMERIVIKCHSYSTPYSLLNAIMESAFLIQENFTQNLSKYLH